jgi:hypothetical protein
MGLAVMALDGRTALTFEHVDYLFEDMTLGCRLASRRKIENKHAKKITSALKMHERPVKAHASPRSCFDLIQIDPEVLDHWYPLRLGPIEIRITEELRIISFCHDCTL